MLCQVSMMGRMVCDPELRRTPEGVSVTSFCVAVDRDYISKSSGERETDFIDCVAWRQTAEFAAKYFAKGQLVGITGRLQTRTWADKEGNKRRNTEVLVANLYFAGPSKKDESAPVPELEQMPEAFAMLEDADYPLPF